jgi:hypothetical protein
MLVRIRFQSDGGLGHFPGLAEPVAIDTAQLPPEEAARIEGLVGGADFFTRPEPTGKPAPGAADLRRYTITVDDDTGRSRTLELTDPVTDPALNSLIDSLRGAGKAGHGS